MAAMDFGAIDTGGVGYANAAGAYDRNREDQSYGSFMKAVKNARKEKALSSSFEMLATFGGIALGIPPNIALAGAGLGSTLLTGQTPSTAAQGVSSVGAALGERAKDEGWKDASPLWNALAGRATAPVTY